MNDTSASLKASVEDFIRRNGFHPLHRPPCGRPIRAGDRVIALPDRSR